MERSEYIWADWIVTNNDMPVRINPDKLAHSISKNLDYIILKKKGNEVADFYVYTKGVYEKCSKQEFKSYIKSYIPLGFASDNILNNIYSLLGCISEKMLEFDKADSNENIINLKNGILDIDKNILMEHSPQYISTIQLNCNYNPQAKAPKFLEFVNRLCSDKNGNVDNEKLLLIQEWTGLLLSNITISRVKKCFVLYSGSGQHR